MMMLDMTRGNCSVIGLCRGALGSRYHKITVLNCYVKDFCTADANEPFSRSTINSTGSKYRG